MGLLGKIPKGKKINKGLLANIRFRPPNGGPEESLLLVNPAERRFIKNNTDGKLNMTPLGVESAYMEGSTSGNYRDSSPSQTSTRSTSSNTGTSGTGGSTNQGRGGSPVGGSTSDRAAGSGASQGGQSNTNRGTTGTGGMNNLGRGGSGIGGGVGFGRDPAMGSNYGRGSWGMQQGGFNNQANQIARSVSTAMNRSGPQYSGPARFGPGAFNANRSQQVFGGYPNSMSGMMPGQVQGFSSPTVNPMAPQASQSTFPARPAAIAQNNVYSPPEVSAMKQARLSTFPARPGVIAENNVYSPPEVSAIKKAREFSQLGYQDPQALQERALALSRGPGSVSAIMTNSPAAWKQTNFALQNAFNEKPPTGATGIGDLVSPPRAEIDQYNRDLRALAVSRGPGSVAGVMPGASPLSQERTLQTLSGAMTDAGTPISPSDLQRLSQTIAGESAGQPAMGQTAVANTMLNRMALAASGQAKYMGGSNIPDLMSKYDATGMRRGTAPNSAFRDAQLGTDTLGEGIASIAGAQSPNSTFNTTMPASIRNATHFLTRDAQIAQAKRPQGPTNWSNNPSQPFTQIGAHLFGNAEPTATQVAALRGTTPPSSGPTMVAGINPAVAPPTPQTPSQPASSWFSGLPGAGMVQDAIASVNENLVQPTQEQIQKYGGFERAGRLARTAVGIMNSFKNTGNPVRTGAGGEGRSNDSGGYAGQSNPQPVNPMAPTPVAPVNTQAPVNPVAPFWSYPQYTQSWAGLPTGIGGPVWRPKPPSAGLFDTPTKKKKKKTRTA